MMRLLITLVLVQTVLFGCTSIPSATNQNDSINQWVTAAEQYERNLPIDHPDHYHSIIHVTPSMRHMVHKQLHGVHKNRQANTIANWLIGEDGHAMTYDVNANLSPIQAFEQRKGNCLSFTILLISLAQEFDIALDYNEVDIPHSWGSEVENSFVFYRHVNAISKTLHEIQVFDLALSNYDARYPQRHIGKRKAIALFHNNKAMQALQNNDLTLAKHYIKLAIALDPQSADLFSNLGSIFKRDNQNRLAESFFLAALKIKPKHIIAASNLERLYRSHANNKQADAYAKLAQKARNENPYFLFKKAQDQNKMKAFRQAKRSINRAKKLHGNDSRFFELSSRINQSLGNYKYAVKELIRAHELAINQVDRNHYANKATIVAQKWVAQKEAKQQTIHYQRNSGPYQGVR